MDESGREVRLRGFNLGGDCKVPFPEGGTHRPTDFADHRTVSFIGRPFPLHEAPEHLERLQRWGCNCLRLLTTWEAVEHGGPGQYDTEYLDYYAEVCRLAGDHGMYVFVDFHQDVWSRMTGGDGAPAWIFEKVGLNFRRFHAADAALVMQHAYDYNDPRALQPERYPTMCWPDNYRRAANGILWTLFFGGRDFAPDCMIAGEHGPLQVQDYLQNHYLGCLEQVARRVRDLPNVVGFDSLNEPSSGWLGQALSDRRLKPGADGAPVRPGLAIAPIDALAAARGIPVRVPLLGISLLRMGVVQKSLYTLNPRGESIWLPGAVDPFEAAGAYRMEAGVPRIVREDFFQRVGTRVVDFDRDYMFPFVERVAERIRAVQPRFAIFAEKDAFATSYHPDFPERVPAGCVNASHWYDAVALLFKRFPYPFHFDALRGRPVFFRGGIRKMYESQLGRIQAASQRAGGIPTLIGEFGIQYDMNGRRALRRYARGDHRPAIWKKHSLALELMYDALDTLLLHSTQWNYTVSNRNDARIGDGWNQEDLSVYSEDQRAEHADPDSGGRALPGFVRPRAVFVQGTLEFQRFDRRSGDFEVRYTAAPGLLDPTELFIPPLQYPRGYEYFIELRLSDSRWTPLTDARVRAEAAAWALHIRVEHAAQIRLRLKRK